MNKIKLHIPVAQYGFFEIEVPEEEAVEVYNRYAETPIKTGNNWQKIKTFTGETVLYDDVNHIYKDLQGNYLLSGSKYAAKFEKPFDLENISKAVGKKHNIAQDTIKDMWSRNGLISRTLGTALHLAMEQWFLHKENGTEKEYHMPKHPFLKEAVLSFPLKDEKILPEQMVSDVERKMVGQIDGIHILKEKECSIIDYKSDADVEKNLKKHTLQLSFYASILERFGWNVKEIVIWNYTDKWTKYELEKEEIEI